MAKNRKKILLIDDDPQICEIYSTKLGASSYKVVTAENGEKGLSAVKKEKPDLILLDILMPVMDGARTLVELKQNSETKNIPVLILTSLEDKPEDIKYAKESGAVDFVNKNADFEDLLKKIKASISQ